MIAVLFTGGTISMRYDPALGGAVPSLSALEIVAATPGLDAVAELEIEQWGRYPGPHMTVELMWSLRNRVADLLARSDVDAVVITHGTDTLEESAYLNARSLHVDKPVVFTGAMRNASEVGWDGPANLLGAARVAASAEARGWGVLVAMAGRVYSGLDVTKADTQQLDAFDGPAAGPIGAIDGTRVIWHARPPLPLPTIAPREPATPVDIVAAYAGGDGRLLDAVRADGRGVVVAGLGRGNVPPPMADAVRRWTESGKPVVIASRTQHGRVGDSYGYAGGGRRLLEMGALFAGRRRPQQARIDLMLAIGAGLEGEALRALFDS